MKAKLLLAVAFCGLLSVVTSTSAQTWTQTIAPTNHWLSVASSADGSKLVAIATNGDIYRSSDSGNNWASNNIWMSTNLPSVGSLVGVASSADGNKLVAVVNAGGVYTSSDSGNTWIQTKARTNNWFAVASSADGSMLVAVADGGGIYSSSDSGNSWTTNNVLNLYWGSVASSADGQVLIACSHNYGCPTACPHICISRDSGTNWTPETVAGLFSACSSDGTKLALAGYGFIFSSTNAGVTWIPRNSLRVNWSGVASSADGSKLVAVAYGGGIYTSSDSGNDWTSNNVPITGWTGVASSADGSKLVAVVADGGIWTWQTTPIPELNIANSNANLQLSWLVPSTNFVLQQSPDFSNWIDVTDKPLLNLTSLENEVTLPPTNSSEFYRLAIP
jgi:photosystem II stability/assembly factor-like uncharacterized protein